jgi:hypothetical protein
LYLMDDLIEREKVNVKTLDFERVSVNDFWTKHAYARESKWLNKNNTDV